MDETVGARKGERTESRVGYRSGYYSRTLAFLLPFTQKLHLPRAIQPKVAGTHSQRFADAGARIIEEQQQRMVTTATWGAGIYRCNNGASLFRFKVCDRSLSRPFVRPRGTVRVSCDFIKAPALAFGPAVADVRRPSDTTRIRPLQAHYQEPLSS
jgi:hypothetical protein